MPGLASSAGKAVHATPPHTRYGTRAGLQAEYSHAALGLLTPPPSVSSYGRVRRSIPVSPSWSIKTESDDIDYLPPHQPSLSASSSAASTPLTAFSPPLPGGRMSSDPFNEVPLEVRRLPHIAGRSLLTTSLPHRLPKPLVASSTAISTSPTSSRAAGPSIMPSRVTGTPSGVAASCPSLKSLSTTQRRSGRKTTSNTRSNINAADICSGLVQISSKAGLPERSNV